MIAEIWIKLAGMDITKYITKQMVHNILLVQKENIISTLYYYNNYSILFYKTCKAPNYVLHILGRHNIHNHNQVWNAVNIQKVSPLEWVIMKEKLTERDILSIDAEKYIENHNNILFQRGYSRPTGH